VAILDAASLPEDRVRVVLFIDVTVFSGGLKQYMRNNGGGGSRAIALPGCPLAIRAGVKTSGSVRRLAVGAAADQY
ncbi:MAG TPA: hypothetical protein VGS97_02585, partial [Actinocrinis sp.]|uniref:hypothetical protein n=1 Tax=Actinocrinis sp. TaxID=1920516 RepID=UPI002DDCAC79